MCAGEKDLALKMYQLLGSSGKIIATLAEKGDFAGLAAYTGQTGQTLNWMQLLQVGPPPPFLACR